MHPFRQTDRTP